MKTAQVAAVFASVTGSALAGFPSCANDCFSKSLNGFSGSFVQLCSDTSRISSLNDCLASAGCNSDDKNTINSYISTNCGKASSFATASGTWSGYGPWGTGGPWTASAASAYRSYTSAHSTGWNSADYSSFTSQYGPVPTGDWSGGGPGFGGPGGPWGSGPGGWKPGNGGPFGAGGWGPYGQNSSWTTGAWTSWWGDDKCPPTTWSGWTSGDWGTKAPWTTWTACTASTTSASTYTTVTNGATVTGTSFGYQVAQASQTGNAAPVGKTVANGAAALAFLGAVLAA